MDSLGLRINAKMKVKNLSVAESQMVEIAKCLTIGAKIIIMDEPTAALAEEEIKILFHIILISYWLLYILVTIYFGYYNFSSLKSTPTYAIAPVTGPHTCVASNAALHG